MRLRLPLPGLYNVYNALGAASRRRSGPRWKSAPGLERFAAAFGRFEGGSGRRQEPLLVLLVKNPAGAGRGVVHTLLGRRPSLLLVALNDATADGKDVSWIWDVDFGGLLSAPSA